MNPIRLDPIRLLTVDAYTALTIGDWPHPVPCEPRAWIKGLTALIGYSHHAERPADTALHALVGYRGDASHALIKSRAGGVSVIVLGRWARVPDEPDAVLNWTQVDRLHEALCRRLQELNPETKVTPAS